MRKISSLILSICFFTIGGFGLILLLSGCSPQGFKAEYVQLPDQLQVAITLLITAAVGWVFAQLIALWPWLGDLIGSYKDQVALALSGAVVVAVQNALDLIPPQYDMIVTILLQLIVAILIFFGVPLAFFKFARQKRLPGFRS